MNKNILLLISLLIIVGIGIVYLLFFQKDKADIQKPISEILRESSRLYNEGLLGVESSMVLTLADPLSPLDSGYEEIFTEAQTIVSFPIKYPKGSFDYKLTQITAWKDQTEGIIAYYKSNSEREFSMQEVSEFYPNELGPPSQEFVLENQKVATLWEFGFFGEDTKKYTLVFDTIEIQDETFYYVLGSIDLTPQELVDIANSIFIL